MIETAIRAAVAALQQGDPSEAERLCREQLAESPDDENLLLLASLSQQRQEKHAEALAGYERLTTLYPRTVEHWINYSTALRVADQAQAAADAALAATRLAPDDARAYIPLGLARLELGDHAVAQEALLKACVLDPASPEAHIHAANALVMVRDAQAYTLLRPWRSWLPLDADEQLLLAHLLTTIGDAHHAYDVLAELHQRLPFHLKTRLQLIALCERKNDLDLSEALLADTTARFSAMDRKAELEVAHLRATLAMRRGDHALARAALEAAGPRSDSDYTHHFLLADIADKLGDTDAAMKSLNLAHARQIEEMKPLAPGSFAPDAALLPNAVARLSQSDRDGWPALVAPAAKNSPIFIVGFPRSGTTLLEQMLDAHPQLQSMDERPFFSILSGELAEHGVHGPEDLHRLNQSDCDELRKRYAGLVSERISRQWSAQLVDKNPLNMLCVPLIQRLFPQAKFILALRHPCDVVLSNYMQNYRSCMLASACSTLERTASAYVAAMESWLHHVDLLKPDMLVSRYEELVDDPVRQTQRFADFLGLDDASPMLRYDQHAREKGFIATPSYTEVIRPVSRRRSDRWRRYQREFESVLPILAPMLRHWGYESMQQQG